LKKNAFEKIKVIEKILIYPAVSGYMRIKLKIILLN